MNKPYKPIPPFKGMVLQNFPFIEEDFDAITNYELLCKVVEYLKLVIANEKIVEENVTNLYNAFVELKNYVDNYFDSTDFQALVNNKLDEMATDGTLANLLNNSLNIVTTFETETEMLNNVSNLVDGLKVKTLGKTSVNDGGGAYFIISDTSSNPSIDLNNGLYANYVNNVLNNYYDEITYEKKRYYDTDCYITIIPLNDKFGNQIKPYVAYGNGKTPTEYARDNYTTLTINASSYITDMEDEQLSGIPIMIGNGNVLNNNPMISEGVSDDILYLGIKEDRSIQEFKVNETNLATLQNNNCINVFDVYYKLINNGVKLNLEGVRIKGSNSIVTTPNPRQCIGIRENKTLVILTCDGRFTDNIGLTSEETQNILIEYGCYNAWNIDGGGSSSTTIKGCKINRNIDNAGTTDRNIPYTLNFKSTTVNEEVAKAYSQIGKEKQELLGQLVVNAVKYQNITSRDLDELVGNAIMGYGNALENTPYAPSTKAGYFINICHSGTSNQEFKQTYNCQFFYERDTMLGYTRRQVNGVFTPWEKIGGNSVMAYNTGGNITIGSTDYEIIPFAINEDLIIVGDTDTMVSSKYTKFKVNKIGLVKITVVCDLVPKTADGDRYVRILKNDALNEVTRQYGIVNQANAIVVEALINNNSLDNTYSFDFKGQENDVITRFRVIAETK